jgi:hypothetical protein
VFAPTKRRHVSYYLSLPFVIAFALLLVAKLADLERAEMVATLADQVAHQETPEATAALRQLAAMPRPPVDILVAAATSADPQLAEEAQVLISGLLRQYQRQIDAGKGIGGVSRQLSDLAAALDNRHEAFSTQDYAWLSGITRKILRQANEIAPEHSPQVAVQCDTVLAAIAANETRIATLVSREPEAAQQPVVTGAFARTSEPPPHDGRPEPRPIQLAERNTQAAVVDAHAIPEPHSDSTAGLDQSTDQREPNRALTWTYPMLNIAPAMPIHAIPVRAHATIDGQAFRDATEDPTAEDAVVRLLANADARDLLRRWLTADGSDLYAIEEELTYRGFGRLSGRLVEQLFSENIEDRLRLVDDVLTAPGIDARPWLMLLADDAEADVRLLALTIMATSDDPLLLDKAWQVALHDRDPRIAGLAERLRERRDNAQRR